MSLYVSYEYHRFGPTDDDWRFDVTLNDFRSVSVSEDLVLVDVVLLDVLGETREATFWLDQETESHFMMVARQLLGFQLWERLKELNRQPYQPRRSGWRRHKVATRIKGQLYYDPHHADLPGMQDAWELFLTNLHRRQPQSSSNW